MNEENKPSYYAVIPSEVRYCEELKYPERLLYGEITALAGKEGYCYATNKYFSELYHVIPGTISRWISHLERLGFVKVEIIKSERNQVLQRRIYINDQYRDFLKDTYKQNKQYPYEHNCLYPISTIAKDNNINIRIDRFFNYIIHKGNCSSEKMTKEEKRDFFILIEKLEFNYTKDTIKMITSENIEKLKIIIYALKELFVSNKNYLITKVTREDLIFIYDTCKKRQKQYQDTEKEISSFFDYYYTVLINKLEKAR